jgi:chromosome segregation ATPase
MNTRDHFLSKQHQSLLLEIVTQKLPYPINDGDDQQLISFHTTTSMNRITNETSHINLQELNETMELLVGGIQALNDDTQRLSSDSIHYQNTLGFLSEEYSKVKLATQETNSLLDAHKSNQQMLEQNLASLQHQIDDLKNTSYDGTLIWKITNVQQKIGMLKRIFSDQVSFVSIRIKFRRN